MDVYHILFFTVIVAAVNAQNASFPDCKTGPMSSFPVCNQSIPSRQRAADLVSRMNITEKISRMSNTAVGIPRLGLPDYQWWSEALHGVSGSPGVHFGGDLPAATSFPMPINLGASFNMSLVYQMGRVISTEARAFNNEGRAGLVFFTPNINIFRDPRWGRGQETPGEDPFLTSSYVYSLIDGLQRGDDERYLKIAADCKHFAAYDLENWRGTDRFHFDARISDQDLYETYMPPFETCIRDAKVASIMCSFNSVNGVPSCGNQFLLETLARESYELDGFVVSDCGAIETIYTQHHYTKTPEETVALALHSGTDLDCGHFYKNNTQAALDNQTIVESDIDRALERTFNILIRLGYFDPPEQQPYRQLTKDDVDTSQARQLALEAAQQSIVLLKNVNNALPLNINQLRNKRIALIGPMVNATEYMQGSYYGKAPYLISPLMAFGNATQGYSINVTFVRGCKVNGTDESGFPAAIELARNSDIVIYIGGIEQSMAREGHDRLTINLPDIQISMIQELEKVTRAPLHVLMMSGCSLDLSYIRDSNQCGSLTWMGFAGQSGGTAIVDVIFGKYNPGGRLPITFYPASYVDAVSMLDMQMRPSPKNPGRTYKFYTGNASYEFGHGLSYTTFNYSWYNDSSESCISIQSFSKQKNSNEKKILVQIYRINVTNTGPVFGNDVVLGYVIPSNASINDPSSPLKRLFAFERVRLNVNETTEVFLPLDVQSLLTIGQDGTKWLEPGSYKIMIGKQQMYTVHLQGNPMKWSSI